MTGNPTLEDKVAVLLQRVAALESQISASQADGISEGKLIHVSGEHAFTLTDQPAQYPPKVNHGREIQIHSPALKILLRDVLREYPMHYPYDELVFTYPYRPLVHNWDSLSKKAKVFEDKSSSLNEEEKKLQSELRILMETIVHGPKHDPLARYFRYRDHHLERHTITWDSLWTIFPPGSFVYGKPFHGEDQVFIVCSLPSTCFPEHGEATWSLICWMLDWNGEAFKKVAVEFSIPKFEAVKPITSLPCYPLSLYRDGAGGEDNYSVSLRPKLMKRGKAFRDICYSPREKSTYRYKGQALTSGLSNGLNTTNECVAQVTPRSMQIDELVIVNASAWYDCANPEPPLGSATLYIGETECKCRDCLGNPHLNNLLKLDWDAVQLKHFEAEKNDTRSQTMTEDDKLLLMLCAPRVLAFAIQTSIWVQLLCKNLELDHETQEFEWKRNFELLQLDVDTKDILRDLVEQHATNKERGSSSYLEDFIPNKGKGLIILLHGPPGVGKTLTAETVAMIARRPLLSIGAANIGLDPKRVEAALKSVFHMAEKLNCVLSLDEADIFVEARTSNRELSRNALVSILLRVLEYHNGILVLTTNRVTSFDTAIYSRINLSVRFDDCTRAQRMAIFRTFISQLDEKDLINDIADIMSWIEEDGVGYKVNGREIRNIVSSSLDLAMADDRKLERRDLKLILRQIRDFQMSLESIVMDSRMVNEASIQRRF